MGVWRAIFAELWDSRRGDIRTSPNPTSRHIVTPRRAVNVKQQHILTLVPAVLSVFGTPQSGSSCTRKDLWHNYSPRCNIMRPQWSKRDS